MADSWKALQAEMLKKMDEGTPKPQDIHRWIAKADELLNDSHQLTEEQKGLLNWLQAHEP